MEEQQQKPTKKKNHFFEIYISKVLKQISPVVIPLTPTDLPLKKVPSSRSKTAGLKDSSMEYSNITTIKPHKYSIISYK